MECLLLLVERDRGGDLKLIVRRRKYEFSKYVVRESKKCRGAAIVSATYSNRAYGDLRAPIV
jgi:hypothetical protein